MNWISCAEKMPEEDGRYLIVVEWTLPPHWVGISSLRKGKFDDHNVSHWQPLPEPPK